MSRLSTRNHDFMHQQSRFSLLNTASHQSRIHKLPPRLVPSSSANALPLQLDLNFYYSTKEGKFELPFTGPIKIPRGTFQLSTPSEIKIVESVLTPSNPISTESQTRLIQEMQNMVPTTVHNRRDLKNCLRTSVRQMRSLKVTPDDFAIVRNLIPQIPYGRNNSRAFFQYCKDGNRLQVEIMLAQDKYLAHVFDPMKMTALHWSALRGYTDIAMILLQSTAYVDAVDCVLHI